MVRRVVHPGRDHRVRPHRSRTARRASCWTCRGCTRLGWRHRTALGEGHRKHLRLVPRQHRGRGAVARWCTDAACASHSTSTAPSPTCTRRSTRRRSKLFGEEALAKPRYKKAAAEPDGGPSEAPKTPTTATTTDPAMDELQLTARQQMQLWDHVRKIENFWTTLPELEPGIIARIAQGRRGAAVGSHLPHDPAVNRRRDDAAAVAALARRARLSLSRASTSCNARAARSPTRCSWTPSSTIVPRIASTSRWSRRPR